MLYKIFAIIVVILGVIFLGSGGALLWKAIRERSAIADGEVVTSEVEAYQQTDSDGVVQTYYRGRYLIRYESGGKVRESLAASSMGYSNRDKVQRRLQGHPRGSVHPIHYDPSRPDSITLSSTQYSTGFALLFVAVGVSLLSCGAVAYFESQPKEW